MEIDSDVVQQVLDELLPFFEGLEAQSNAILRFMKDNGMATDQDLAPYLQQAGDAANVKWRAARLRFGRLFALLQSSTEQAADTRKQSKETEVQQTQLKTPENGQHGDADAGEQSKSSNGKPDNEAEAQVEEADAHSEVGPPKRKEQPESANAEQAQSVSQGEASEVAPENEFKATSETREDSDKSKDRETAETRSSREQPAQGNQKTTAARKTKPTDVRKGNAA